MADISVNGEISRQLADRYASSVQRGGDGARVPQAAATDALGTTRSTAVRATAAPQAPANTVPSTAVTQYLEQRAQQTNAQQSTATSSAPSPSADITARIGNRSAQGGQPETSPVPDAPRGPAASQGSSFDPGAARAQNLDSRDTEITSARTEDRQAIAEQQDARAATEAAARQDEQARLDRITDQQRAREAQQIREDQQARSELRQDEIDRLNAIEQSQTNGEPVTRGQFLDTIA